MAIQHSELRVGTTVSIWLGSFRTEGELDSYLKHDFSADFGFTYEPQAGPEACTRVGEPVPVRELLSKFSMSRRFIDRAVECATAHGWAAANSAVVFYSTRYDPGLATTDAAPLHFIGAIDVLPRQ